MKTTIDFPDALLQRAKLVAVQRKTTLKDIVLQGVDYVISRAYRSSADYEAKERQAHMMRLLEAMKASNTEPMVPLKREEIYER